THSENQDGNAVIAGLPIIDAFKYESKQQWVGVMLAPSALKLMLDQFRNPIAGNDWRWRSRLWKYPNIPLLSEAGTSTNMFDSFAVCPTARDTDNIEGIIVDRERAVKRLSRL